MAKLPTSQQLLLDEWKEARSSIGRFDEYLLNLRRYGFTLATIMIGADAYLSTSMDILPWAKAGAAIVVMILIFALFLLDQRVKLLQDIVLMRAAELEDSLGTQLSTLRRDAGQTWHIKHTGLATYIFFLAAAGIVGGMSVVTTDIPESASWALHKSLPLAVVIVWCLVLCVLTPVWDLRARSSLINLLHPTAIRQRYRRYLDWVKKPRSE